MSNQLGRDPRVRKVFGEPGPVQDWKMLGCGILMVLAIIRWLLEYLGVWP